MGIRRLFQGNNEGKGYGPSFHAPVLSPHCNDSRFSRIIACILLHEIANQPFLIPSSSWIMAKLSLCGAVSALAHMRVHPECWPDSLTT